MRKVITLVIILGLLVLLTVSCSNEDSNASKEQLKVEGMALSDGDKTKGVGGAYVEDGPNSESGAKEEVNERIINIYYYNPVDDCIVYEKATFDKKENKETYFFEKYFKFVPSDKLVANMPGSTKINSINYYEKKGLVVMDVSENFTQLMNIGGGVEGSIIQCIANTLCESYGAKRLIITTNGEDYQGSHLEISPMNSIAINTKGVKELKNK
ncbi:MAG: GerMN domain-containing protein [Clostridium sp.]|uniref:GerMN domain-containing protein n=1 Tax=Clostridium sp. TaxID=1506 RepID=UPI002FCB5DB8